MIIVTQTQLKKNNTNRNHSSSRNSKSDTVSLCWGFTYNLLPFFLSDPIRSIGPTKDSICSPVLSVVLGNFKSSDWSTRFMKVILLAPSLVRISWGHQTSTVAVRMLQCARGTLYNMCTQTGTEAGFMCTAVKLFQAQCVHHEYPVAVQMLQGAQGTVHKLLQRLDLNVQL
jgi:hypothetical protein